jgi:hypothetical protein
MDRREFLQAGVALGAITSIDAPPTTQNPMSNDASIGSSQWLRIADPVLRALSEGKLKERMQYLARLRSR